jgi:Phosphotransferase enzyme family
VAGAVTARRVRRVVTHQVSLDYEGLRVVKRYVDSRRGEPYREWRALQLLAEHAPRLAPEPVSADLDARPPSIVMSLLPGEPLGGRPLTEPQEHALAVAVGQLWQAVPVEVVTPLRGELGRRPEFVSLVSDLAATAADPDPDPDPMVHDAVVRGAAWLARAEVTLATPQSATPQVLGQGDGNLANYLWDGELVRIVDFEDSGVSDRALELADLVEHVSVWRDSGLDTDRFTEGFDLSPAERARLADSRRLTALFWLLHLRQRGDFDGLRRQAERLLSLL